MKELPQELPVETLALVLQEVTIKHRLKSCALVSRSWMAAAMAATNRINIRNMPEATCSSLSAWLAAHGSNVDVMSLSGGKPELQELAAVPSLGIAEDDQGPEAAETELQELVEDDERPEAAETAPAPLATLLMQLQLPCSRLVDFSAARLMRHLHPGACPDGTYSSVLSVSANLTKLCLQDCVTCQVDSLYALSTLTKLQELSLQNVTVPSSEEGCNVSTISNLKAPVPNRLLPLLGHLTSMELNQHMSLSAVKSIRRVTGLRSLVLDLSTVHKKGVTAAWANMQSPDWQQLSLAMCHGHTSDGKLKAAGIDGLTRLASLKVLKLKHHVFMGACALVLPQLPGLQHLHVEGMWWFHEQLALFPAVLSAFSALTTQLTHLSIQDLPYCWEVIAGGLTALSGLTASSNLRELRVRFNTYSHDLLSAATKAMFAPTKVWLSLTTLQLGNYCSTWGGENQGLPAVLSQCCPNLQNLRMASPNLKLQQLSALAHLSLLHLDTKSLDGADELAVLTNLRSLTLAGSTPDGTAADSLLALTQLQQLTRICITRPMQGLRLCLSTAHSKAPDPTTPEVWAQLQHCLEGDGLQACDVSAMHSPHCSQGRANIWL